MDLIIEELTLEQLETAAQLFSEMWDEVSLEEARIDCRQIIADHLKTIFLANIKGESVGFIFLSMRTDHVEGTQSSPVAYIEGIYVRPNFQKQGIASALVTTGENWGRELGAREIASDVELANVGSISFHQKLGFREANRVVCFAKTL